MVSSLVSRLVILVFGTLYPAYASYKAVKTKNVKEHVKWMMYWIVFALFTCIETITDVLFSWFPFYYEIKIIIVIWLLSPATRGSSILYRKFVHPTLASKEQGGGGLVNQLRKSYSLSDLTSTPVEEDNRITEEGDNIITDPRLLKKKKSPKKSNVAAAAAASGIYFSEVDVRKNVLLGQVHSTEDISSGYSSGEVYSGQTVKIREGLIRSSSLSSTRPRSLRTTRSTVAPKRTNQIAEDEEFLLHRQPFNIFKSESMCNLSEQEKLGSSSDLEFQDCIEDDGKDLVKASSQQLDNVSMTEKVLRVANRVGRDNSLCEKTLACKGLMKEVAAQKIWKLQRSRSLESIISLDYDIQKRSSLNEKRGGRYNKKRAPPPPCVNKEAADWNTDTISGQFTTDIEVPAITATLILKPELVKSGTSFRNVSNSSPTGRLKLDYLVNRLIPVPKVLRFWQNRNKISLKEPSHQKNADSTHFNMKYQAVVCDLRKIKTFSKSDSDFCKPFSLTKLKHKLDMHPE